MANIVQWNCRGLKVNFLELTLLIQSFLPVAVALQEGHLKKSDNMSLKGYHLYSTFSNEDERAAGGSSIFVRNNIIHSEIDLTTDLQAVAVRISLDKTTTLCSIYIPPNQNISIADLKNLTDQLPTPFLLMGDFNAHNPLWGSNNTNDRGKKIEEDFLAQENLCFLNDGSDTYLHPGYGSYSSIDLSICDPSLLLDYSWQVHDDLCGSDHFPIIIEGTDSSTQYRPQRWKLHKADWPRYRASCLDMKLDDFINKEDPILAFNGKFYQLLMILFLKPRQFQNIPISHGTQTTVTRLYMIEIRLTHGSTNNQLPKIFLTFAFFGLRPGELVSKPGVLRGDHLFQN